MPNRDASVGWSNRVTDVKHSRHPMHRVAEVGTPERVDGWPRSGGGRRTWRGDVNAIGRSTHQVREPAITRSASDITDLRGSAYRVASGGVTSQGSGFPSQGSAQPEKVSCISLILNDFRNGLNCPGKRTPRPGMVTSLIRHVD